MATTRSLVSLGLILRVRKKPSGDATRWVRESSFAHLTASPRETIARTGVKPSASIVTVVVSVPA